jgi:hypothetical protein
MPRSTWGFVKCGACSLDDVMLDWSDDERQGKGFVSCVESMVDVIIAKGLR